MSKMSVKKQAERDATEYAAAYMSYGEGAGTRRKLIEGTVDYKMSVIPGYRDEFISSSKKQNMAQHAEKAKKAQRRRQANTAISRNTKAVVTGKYENVNTGILLTGAVAVILHKTGADKKLVQIGKKAYKDVRRKYDNYRRPDVKNKKHSDDATVHNITDV